MSVSDREQAGGGLTQDEPDTEALADWPLGDLPRLTSSLVRIERRVRLMEDAGSLAGRLLPGMAVELGPVECVGRATGLNRPGVIAQFAWPRLDVRVGFGIETPIAHAVVDQLLGFERPAAELQRQVTPVEFGVLTFVLARALDRLDALPGPLGAWDLSIDRIGPDPFDPRDLGTIVTWRWPVRVGLVRGSIRLWAPESILARLDEPPAVATSPRPGLMGLSSTWRAEAATITLARGLARLKLGVVLPIDAGMLRGSVASPVGPIALVCLDRDGRCRIEVQAVPNTSTSRVTVRSPIDREPTPREPIPVSMPTSTPTPTAVDLPVTLVVELGRVNLSLGRLADLKPGDVIELGRHSREPVELTSNGKLVARGELVQIDTELGVRVTNVLL